MAVMKYLGSVSSSYTVLGVGLWISGPLLLEGDISRAYDEFITKPIESNPRDRFKHSNLYL